MGLQEQEAPLTVKQLATVNLDKVHMVLALLQVLTVKRLVIMDRAQRIMGSNLKADMGNPKHLHSKANKTLILMAKLDPVCLMLPLIKVVGLEMLIRVLTHLRMLIKIQALVPIYINQPVQVVVVHTQLLAP